MCKSYMFLSMYTKFTQKISKKYTKFIQNLYKKVYGIVIDNEL